MSADVRAQLAARQAELVAALTGRAAPPAGFDVARVHATLAALANKRRSAVLRVWPALRNCPAERFAAYAQAVPLPRVGGPLADGRAFVRWLEATGDFPDVCKLQALALDLRYRATADGLVPRRGPALKLAMLSAPRRLVMALRLPWLGEHWLTVPIGRLGMALRARTSRVSRFL